MSETIQIMVPEFCRRHQRQILDAWGIGPQGTWRAALVMANIAMFQACSSTDDFHLRVKANIQNVKDVGCLACFDPELFKEIVAAGFDGVKAKGESYVIPKDRVQ